MAEETFPHRFLSFLFFKLALADACSNGPVTQRILEITIGAVFGKRLAGNLKDDTRENGFTHSPAISRYTRFW